MESYEATVETADDGTRADPEGFAVEFRNARTGQRQRFSFDQFTGGHLLHLAVAGCVYNDLYREAAARGLTLTHVSVSADGGFAGEPCASSGITYRIHVEGAAPRHALQQLVAHVQEIAEVPSALRVGADVRPLPPVVVSTEG
ncbi:OsmC family protein [Nocardioides guangzhouensis]|uniref:OsmC family protein n=1 Tax=Nocardioides guangzhouensis TaxID=2497878 RepID=UPI0014383EF1|nr:OsmC family protein [Nocardioides guangzhouensis]